MPLDWTLSRSAVSFSDIRYPSSLSIRQLGRSDYNHLPYHMICGNEVSSVVLALYVIVSIYPLGNWSAPWRAARDILVALESHKNSAEGSCPPVSSTLDDDENCATESVTTLPETNFVRLESSPSPEASSFYPPSCCNHHGGNHRT
ncbi:hypothetical protein LX36DRAFT_444827 [Colletotrichum falcatum]|nr:hypothetical protein LX36DRAFT_444827 [Colletotrichum falcatum]